jgi:hypothetical protein
MTEHRSHLRQKTFLQGRVYFNNRRSSLDCIVRDMSDEGARLKVSNSVALPEVVELHIPNRDETYRAKIQWRSGDELGLTFDQKGESPSLVPNAPSADLAGRVRRLEAELATLQRKVHELQNELRKRLGAEI